MKRKQFILQSALVAAGLQASSFMKVKKDTGIQLWSLRKAMQEDAAGTLKKVAQTGYTFVEPAGHNIEAGTFHGLAPKELKKIVNGLGMKMHSAHCKIDVEDADKACTQAAEAGLKYIIKPAIGAAERKSLDNFKKLAEDFNKIGLVAKKYGLQFGFHNHAHEFGKKDGQIPYDYLLANTDAANVIFQMDLGWVVYAGYDPVEYFKKYPGRFQLWHIRDLDPVSRDSIAIGKGNLDLAPIFKEKKLAGFKYGIVEISSKDETNAFENIISSYSFLNGSKFY